MLRISKADFDLIRWEAERSYPRECCGVLLGTASAGQRIVTLTLSCENARSASPGTRYRIKPEQVLAALKLARNRGETVVGFYPADGVLASTGLRASYRLAVDQHTLPRSPWRR